VIGLLRLDTQWKIAIASFGAGAVVGAGIALLLNFLGYAGN
jgi:hypothetical protein